MSGPSAVVTGGSGFIGSHLVERLIHDGEDVVVYDGMAPFPDQRLAREHARHVAGDIRDTERLARAIVPGVQVVYHLAAVVGVDRYLGRPAEVVDVTINGTWRVLERAAEVGARVVVASTSEIFGKNPAVPWAESADRVLGPTTTDRWVYSTSKATAEHLTFAFAKEHRLSAGVVRYFNVYGPRQRPAYLVSRSIHRALNGHDPLVYDDGRQTRSFTFVADAVAGTVLAGRHPDAAGEVFNIGSGVESTVGEAIELICGLTGRTGSSPVDTARALGTVYEDLSRRVPETAKAAAVLGFRADTSLASGLARTVDWARANPWWLALHDTGAGR